MSIPDAHRESDRARHIGVRLALVVVFLSACSGPARIVPPGVQWTAAARRVMGAQAMDSLIRDCAWNACGVRIDAAAHVDSVLWDPETGRLAVHMNDVFAQSPFREEAVAKILSGLEERIDPTAGVARVDVVALGVPIEQLVPNVYRTSTSIDGTRRPAGARGPRPLVRRLDDRPIPARGLNGRHIALWQSHGWYYERRLDRWEWQRARLFESVEDILPTAFVLPYLAPMLERAGAMVWMPRERDLQHEMVVVDNDGSGPGSVYRETGAWTTAAGPGFAIGRQPYGDHENPFRKGQFRWIESVVAGGATASWQPVVPVSGEYAVHVSWGAVDRATPAASYTVRHAGGESRFEVDQRMAAGTWVYLGTFDFRAGAPVDSASVTLDNAGPAGTVVSADAVRFGGGMGLVARNGKVSGRPRWAEAARYHLQYSGMPDSLVYNVTETDNDYVDDYRGRAEWVNFLRGSPYGPNKNRSAEGLGVPIDLSLAFHTDAGVTRGDSTIGTLVIYSREGADTTEVFPDGMSRFANRDLADLLQTEVVEDIRALFDPEWSRRSIWDRDYSEAVRPNVPSVLLELLSHQNFADMRFGLDPRFRFVVARAIYKAMTRFVASQNGEPEPVIQPLAPRYLEARLAEPGRVLITWKPTPDVLEPSARPTGYVLYTRRGQAGFDTGRYVTTDTAWVSVDAGVDYSFRVAAVNDGGESAGSEIVAAAWMPGSPNLLIVSAFDRLSAPAAMDLGPWRGFLDDVDHGVADGYEISFVGRQKEFDSDVPWRDDDDPGHGASYADHETQLAPGNTFDYPSIHGRSARRAGWGYSTVSDERLEETGVPDGFAAVDLLLGEERETTPGGTPAPEYAAFPSALVDRLLAYTGRGGALFVSGSYVGTELAPTPGADDANPVETTTQADAPTADGTRTTPKTSMAREVLHISLRASRAVVDGGVASIDPVFMPTRFRFHTERNPVMYAAEAPDAIEPAGDGARTILRYTESNMSAGVAYAGHHAAVTLGFPFETIASGIDRDRLMASILAFLSEKTPLETP